MISSDKQRELYKEYVNDQIRCMLIDIESDLSNISDVCVYELYFESNHIPIQTPIAKHQIKLALDIIHNQVTRYGIDSSEYTCLIHITAYNNLRKLSIGKLYTAYIDCSDDEYKIT